MKKDRIIKYLLGRGTELAIVLLLVSVSFAIFTVVLFKVFPLGLTLSQVLEKRSGKERSSDILSNGGGMFGEEGGGLEETAATLAQIGNEVRSKGASSIAWGPAQQGMKLRNHDAVQTFTDSSAQINFDVANYLTMGSNSLVIIKKMEQDKGRDERRSTVVVVEGQLQGHVANAGPNSLQLNITTPSAAVKMQPGGAVGRKADFKIAINPDHSSTILVYSGAAEVSAQGKTVRVSKNSGVTVKQGEAPKAATPLPSAPKPCSPAEGSVVGYRDLPQPVRFTWTGGKSGSRFRLQLARDRSFKEVVMDRDVSAPESAHGNLKKGTYFWRVSRVEEGLEGAMSAPQRFQVIQNADSPPLHVSFPAAPVTEERFLLTGSTAPGNRVYVGGNAVATDQGGRFSCEVPVKPGPTLVTVEAIDGTGNVSYRSAYVQRRF